MSSTAHPDAGADGLRALLADPQRGPRAHPVATAEHLFDYSVPVHTADHLLRFYNALYKAAIGAYPDALRQVAALMPRGHGKTEAGTVVTPAWVLARWPDARIAVISKTEGAASERVEKVGRTLTEHSDRLGITLTEQTKTAFTTAANDAAGHKEPSMSAHGINSQVTGGHYDVLVFDDVVDWENQRLQSRRRKIRDTFEDYSSNLLEKDSTLPTGPVTIAVGTRKHPRDLYATELLADRSWLVFEERALADWSIVADGAYQIKGQDGRLYDSPGDLPADVDPVQDGVVPEREVDVLWPELQPLPRLLHDVVFGDRSPAIWKRENQNDPAALQGSVFKPGWLTYVDALPGDPATYDWYAGLDVAVVEDAQAAAEGEGDFSALAILGDSGSRRYLTHLWRTRGRSVKGTADWAAGKIADATVAGHDLSLTRCRVETNKAPGVHQRLRDDHPVPAVGHDSTTAKEGRLHDLAGEFQGGDLVIRGDQTADRWRRFEQEEWLQFPDAAHDDRLDAIDLADSVADAGGTVHDLGSMGSLLG